jgi:predicted DNA-binding ribbon-helix-helix protein
MLPNMIVLNKKTLKGNIKDNIKIEDYFYEELKKMRKKSNITIHVMLLTNSTEKYEEYENNLYTENNTDNELLKIKCGLAWNKEKELDNKSVKEYLKKHKEEKKSIEEYEIYRNIINKLTYEGCKYVSFVYGGYKEIHNLSLILNIPLTSHNKEKCFFCIEYNNKIINEEKITKENFDKLCNNKDNKIFPCIYNSDRKGIIIFYKHYFKVLSELNNKKLLYNIIHILKKTNIVSYSNIEKGKTSIDFLYSLNNTLSNLVWIKLNLLDKNSFKEFIRMCRKNDLF